MYETGRYSEFGDSNDQLTTSLTAAAGDTETSDDLRVAAALDEFERQETLGADPIALRRALAGFVCHHPASVALRLRLPDLDASAPWLAWPARR